MDTTNKKSKREHSKEESKRSPAKRKFRNENEKRRRDLFSQLISSLENILNIDKKPSSTDQTSKLDKASILRETAVYLKNRQNDLTIQITAPSTSCRTTNEQTDEVVDFSWKPPSNLVTTDEWTQIAIEAMGCFFLVAKPDPYNGQIVHVSKNISSLLDYSHNELLNRSLFELILPRDHDQLRDYLLKDHRIIEKCNLSWRRGTADECEECTIIGAFRQVSKRNDENDEKYLMSIVKVNTIDRTLTINDDNSINEFTTRLNLRGRFVHVDSKARQILGYSSYELIGYTYFDFVHPDDLSIMTRAYQLWKDNGSGTSEPYRFLSKGQQWIFLQTTCQAQINSWTGKPESYICTTNLLPNSTNFLQKQPSTFSQTTISNIQSPLTTNTVLLANQQIRSPSSDSQITSFLSQLDNETYRTNIREKLNERRLCKQAEMRVREEEINVIEDILQFINEYESKRLLRSSLRTTNPRLHNLPMIINSPLSSYQTTTINPEGFNIHQFETTTDPTLIQSPLAGSFEESSPRSVHNLSREPHHQNLLIKDEPLIDPLASSLFSPQQGPFSIPSPTTPFSIPSRPSPMTPAPLSVSPISSSPYPRSISPPINTSATNDATNVIPSTASSSSSSSSSSTEQTTKKSSYNRSLPKSLVS
ncbi:unnamed protein product [Adineta steineri]|uniref:Uncharacterized protein n=1 Tax=Adineta steineri TaxID=433720 RepID=A0A816CUK3_9BILA|nr:unnamed protein product [Adineta steineri]CAF1628841.1 unnamed protein product [Adineta steineri]